jgi:hypothetical protein
VNWILRQLKQPSTWKGIFLVAGVIGYGIKPELQEQIIIAVTAIIGIIEIYRNEHKPQPINVVLPPIELVSTHLAAQETQAGRVVDSPSPVAVRHSSAERLRESVPPNDGPEQSGFGDR